MYVRLNFALLFLNAFTVITFASSGENYYESDDQLSNDASEKVLFRQARESEHQITKVSPHPSPLPTIKVPGNETAEIMYDSHIYYNSTFHAGTDEPMYWTEFDTLPNAVKHDMLSNSHRKASSIKLSFGFPFYGHIINQVTIATGGFVYVGTIIHNWLAATQYIAPFMANFDTSMSNDSTIMYVDNGTAFIIQWANMSLRDQPEAGEFTFQVTLKQSGDIIMSYLQVPLAPLQVKTTHHPVKVGLSDAFVIQSQLRLPFTTQKRNTIYEYHLVNLKHYNLTDNSYIYLTALPTCLEFKNCSSCISADIGFNCKWCESMKRCSTGRDRKRQEWLNSRCVIDAVSDSCSNLTTANATAIPPSNVTATELPSTTSTAYVTTESTSTFPKTGTEISQSTPSTTITVVKDTTISEAATTTASNNKTNSSVIASHDQITSVSSKSSKGAVSVAGILGMLLVLVIILAVVGWVAYAYKNPQTPSGQLLIKYRPSQWKSQETSARYSTSMHM